MSDTVDWWKNRGSDRVYEHNFAHAIPTGDELDADTVAVVITRVSDGEDLTAEFAPDLLVVGTKVQVALQQAEWDDDVAGQAEGDYEPKISVDTAAGVNLQSDVLDRRTGEWRNIRLRTFGDPPPEP